MMDSRKIGIVGPCTAGKSTLAVGLQQLGYNAKYIVQEHSYVPSMWQRLSKPDLLIFLDVSYEVSRTRKKLNWTAADLLEQHHRLAHARQHADFYLLTDPYSIPEVLDQVLAFLQTGATP